MEDTDTQFPFSLYLRKSYHIRRKFATVTFFICKNDRYGV